MEQFVGLDVSQKLTHVCVVDQKGTVLWRGTCLSTPDDIAETIRARAPHAERIGLETGSSAIEFWVLPQLACCVLVFVGRRPHISGPS
jgi:transposase